MLQKNNKKARILGAISVDLMADDKARHGLSGYATITIPYVVPAEISDSFDEANLAILYIDDSLKAVEAMRLMGMKPNTWYRRVHEYEEGMGVRDSKQ